MAEAIDGPGVAEGHVVGLGLQADLDSVKGVFDVFASHTGEGTKDDIFESGDGLLVGLRRLYVFSQRVGSKDMVCIADIHQQTVLSPRKRESELKNLTCLSMLPWEHGMCDTAKCTEVDLREVI